MSEYEAGQRVKVEYEATVEQDCREGDKILYLRLDDTCHRMVNIQSVKVTNLDPANWPPQVGDIWATGDMSKPACESVTE